MEIQLIEQNELQVKYNYIEKHKAAPDFTLGSKYSSFRADLRPSILVKGTCQLIFCSIPPILTIVAIFFQNFVNVYYAIQTQDKILISAFALGVTFLNLFGYNIIFSFNNNLMALISQAHGARDPYAVGVHFQRGLIFQIPLFCILLISMYFFEGIITFLGMQMDGEIMAQASQFVKWSAVSVLFSGIFDVGRIYMCGQNLFEIPFYVKLIITLTNLLLADALIDRYGLIGLAIAKNVGEFLGIIVLYVRISTLELNSWIRPTIKMWTKWWDYFKFIFTGGLALYLHFLYIEILTIFVANLNDKNSLSAHISFINLRPLLFAIPLGTSVSVSSFVGQSVGEKAKKKAQTAALMGLIACNIYFLIQMVVGYWLSGPLKKFLSISDESEIVQFDIIFNLYIFFIIYLESHQLMFTGIMKGIGLLSKNLQYYIIGFYLIGIPLAYALGMIAKLRLQGIWISYLVSNFIVCIFQIMFFMKQDWDDFLQEKGVDLDNELEIPTINFDYMNKKREDSHENQNERELIQYNNNGQNSHYSPPDGKYMNSSSSSSKLLKK